MTRLNDCCQDDYIFPFSELNNSDLNIELFGINGLPFHDFCNMKFDPFDYNEFSRTTMKTLFMLIGVAISM